MIWRYPYFRKPPCVPLSPQTICPAESAESDDIHIFQPKAQGFHFHSESFPFSLLVFLPGRRCMDRAFNPGFSFNGASGLSILLTKIHGHNSYVQKNNTLFFT